jgi:hypothetical protein
MRTVEIIMTATDTDGARTWGEVKAVDETGLPTIAHVESRMTYNDAFHAKPGRHVFQFSVDRRCKITLNCKVDGATIGPSTDIDCSKITAGQRYNFEVPV